MSRLSFPAVPFIMSEHILHRRLKRLIPPPLVVEGVSHRMPVQDFAGTPVVRRDDDPLMAGHRAPQTDVMRIANENIVLFY